jgi:predicted glycosyltransferase
VRILCHTQHLSGVGHFVRTHALASGLAEAHDVLLVDGGRPVPRLPSSPRMTLLSLPRIHHRAGVLVALREDRPLAEIMEERIRRLVTAISELRPDVVTVEHFPFSKWELEEEILAAIGTARRVRPGVRVVCSLRDVAPRTGYEAVEDREYERRVLNRLGSHFDALLVHADPRFSRLEEHFPAAGSLPIPCDYTGFVSRADAEAFERSRLPYAVLSAGGGGHALRFLLAAIEAFRRLSSRGELGSMRLVVFAGLFMETADLDTLRAETRGDLAAILPFCPEFPRWLRRSALSISQAGYNTCVDLLSARVPAVLVPDPGMSDQFFRAERMRRHGLAATALGDPVAVDTLMDAIRRALNGPPPSHDFGLRGVEETRARLEQLQGMSTLCSLGASSAAAD